MKSLPFTVFMLCAVVGTSASADTLLVDRAQLNRTQQPAHGKSAAEVKQRYGTPVKILPARGGQKLQWPKIERWVYDNYTVYLEHGHVIDTVLNQANAQEVGPRAPDR